MIHPDEAVAMMAGFMRTPRLETVPLQGALGRILASPVHGRMDQPPFDKAAMDGWAWQPMCASGASSPPAPAP